LNALSADERRSELSAFEKLRLSRELEGFDWINSPAQFSEMLSAHLWATHQIDGFRAAAVAYVERFNKARPPAPAPVPRLGIAVIGQSVRANDYRLFRKLRRRGTYFPKVVVEDAWPAILAKMKDRAAAHPGKYAHWYIDGAFRDSAAAAELTGIAYGSLTPVRAELQARIKKSMESKASPELLRTQLAQLRPEDLKLDLKHTDAVLSRFEVNLLTEGSGTQIYSTIFVQWAAREALRRAQPLTLLARFTPRQRERAMNELLDETRSKPELDPRGSLIDADIGAYYTWLNMQRLPDAEKSNFLVWFENHSEAMAVGPKFQAGRERATETRMTQLLHDLS
jgi:hypothetical protein